MHDDGLKLDQQLCFPLYAAARKVMRLYTPLLEPLGLTYTQYITLLVLWETDGIPIKRIGDLLYLDTGTLTPVLKKLEKQHLVRRQRDPSDERSVLVYLTAQGRLLKPQAAHVPREVAASIQMKHDDARQLRHLLKDFLADSQP